MADAVRVPRASASHRRAPRVPRGRRAACRGRAAGIGVRISAIRAGLERKNRGTPRAPPRGYKTKNAFRSEIELWIIGYRVIFETKYER